MPEPAKRTGGGNSFFWRISALLPDDDFLHAFFGLTLANSEFRHRDHLRLATISDSHGTWFGTDQGIYLYTGTVLMKVSNQPGYPANGCF